MGKSTHMRLKGAQNIRMRLLLATLSSTPITIEDIRPGETWPGLRPHEISLLHLIEKVSDDCVVKVYETGTKLKYKPGILMGGRGLTHDCGISRSIGYFLEPLIILALFGKKPLSIKLTGITNDSRDPSVDTFRSATLPMLKRFGVPIEGLELKIESRGVPPGGGGEVLLTVPMIHSGLTAINWVEEGMVNRIRGVSFSTRVSPQFENSLIHSARGVFNRLLPDVYIFTDHRTGAQAGKSPGYGVSLVAETTGGCHISVDFTICYSNDEEIGGGGDGNKKGLMSPEEGGKHIGYSLLEEIKQGGVVDSTHQAMVMVLCALCPPDVSKVRLGQLSPYTVEALRHIRDFLGVVFDIEPEPATHTVILKCVGCGLTNFSRKLAL